MNEIFKGDVVIANRTAFGITFGNEYVVLKDNSGFDIMIENDDNKIVWYGSHRFTKKKVSFDWAKTPWGIRFDSAEKRDLLLDLFKENEISLRHLPSNILSRDSGSFSNVDIDGSVYDTLFYGSEFETPWWIYWIEEIFVEFETKTSIKSIKFPEDPKKKKIQEVELEIQRLSEQLKKLKGE